MFDQLISEAATRFNLSTPTVTALLRELLSTIMSERTGGPTGFLDQFRRAGLADLATSWLGGKEERPISPVQVESALGVASLDRLANASGLARGVVASAVSFLLPKLIGRLTPGGAFATPDALRAQLAGFLGQAEAPAAARAASSQGWGWLPWAAAAALAVAALLWFRQPTGTIDPQLTISNRNGKITYSGVVRDESTQTAIVSALRTAFGENNIEGSLRVDRDVKQAAWLPRLGELFTALKTPGVEFSLNGNAIGLGGWLSAADRQALGDRLRGILGSGATVSSLGDAALNAVRAANDDALSALGAIGTSGVTADSLVRAMNLSIINFASGSAEIPSDNMNIIRTSAEALKRAPAGSAIEIAGHTDNTGDSTANSALSQARADSVKAALVHAGVNAAMLTTRGYGDTKPRAPNDTEYGRFQNRRIEYAVR